MKGYPFLVIAILSEIIATSALKSSDGFSKLIPTIVVFVGYGLAFWLLSVALRSLPLGLTYATWSGLGIVGASFIGLFLFGEHFGPMKLFGFTLIILGVVIANIAPGSTQ